MGRGERTTPAVPITEIVLPNSIVALVTDAAMGPSEKSIVGFRGVRVPSRAASASRRVNSDESDTLDGIASSHLPTTRDRMARRGAVSFPA